MGNRQLVLCSPSLTATKDSDDDPHLHRPGETTPRGRPPPAHGIGAMQTAMQPRLLPPTSLPLSPQPMVTGSTEVKASVNKLLSTAHSLPCSKGALAFTQMLQPMARFQVALDALLPILDSTTPAEVSVKPISVRSAFDDNMLDCEPNSCIFHPLHSLCTTSYRREPFQVGLVRNVYQRAGKGCQLRHQGGWRKSERTTGVGFVEDLERGRQ